MTIKTREFSTKLEAGTFIGYLFDLDIKLLSTGYCEKGYFVRYEIQADNPFSVADMIELGILD